MIKVARLPKPKVLVRNETEWTNAIIQVKTSQERTIAINKYKHQEIKQTLVKMFAGKCAFCESQIMHVDFGDIEHFKPKSKFPADAVMWKNLLLSCKRCNGAEFKGDKFPLEHEGGLLINPCDDEPSDHFSFEFDKDAQIAIVFGKTTRGKTSERIYGLNKPDLLQQRTIQVKRLIALAQYYNSDQRAKLLLDEACESKNEFAAFARMVRDRYSN